MCHVVWVDCTKLLAHCFFCCLCVSVFLLPVSLIFFKRHQFTALHHAMNELRHDHDAEHEAVVKGLFEELELRAAYRVYEEATRDEIQGLIDAQADATILPCGMAIYQDILNKLYGRDK